MDTYIALLRGVNVSGKNLIKMDELKLQLSNSGLQQVSTYIQSGNIIFKHKDTSNTELAKRINQTIKSAFEFDVAVVVKKQVEIKQMSLNNTFLKIIEIDLSKLHLTFLFNLPSKQVLEKFKPENIGNDLYQVKNDIVYLYCPGGYGKTKLNNSFLENKLKVSATTRNWNTVLKLAGL